MKEGVTAAGYTDEGAQLLELAKDRGLEMVSPQVEEEVARVLMEKIRMRSGMIVQLGQPQPVQQQAPQPNPGGNPMRPAAIGGAVGGSGNGTGSTY